MGADTKIQWTDHTFNIVWGCTKVSEGCKNCYAEAFAARTGHDVWGLGGTRRVLSDSYWAEPLKWDRDAQRDGVRRRVFCSSMADVFEDHPTVAEQRERLWPLIFQTPYLDWLLLTKRPQNMRAMLPPDWLARPLSNVWLGTTAETQVRVDERLPHLLDTPAVVHFVSAEPLLERITLRGFRPAWLIIGGESGGGARPFEIEWARALVAECRANGYTRPFVKQFGAHVVADPYHLTTLKHRLRLNDRKGGDWSEWPSDLRIREYPTPYLGHAARATA